MNSKLIARLISALCAVYLVAKIIHASIEKQNPVNVPALPVLVICLASFFELYDQHNEEIKKFFRGSEEGKD